MSQVIVFLLSTVGGNLAASKQTSKIDDWLTVMKLSTEKVDGAAPESRELRGQLWEVAGERGYPMLFLKNTSSGEITFLGGYDTIEYLIESEQFAGLVANVAKTE